LQAATVYCQCRRTELGGEAEEDNHADFGLVGLGELLGELSLADTSLARVDNIHNLHRSSKVVSNTLAGFERVSTACMRPWKTASVQPQGASDNTY
jgi:hypothetical protein